MAFSPDTLDFLFINKMNDNRDFFNENRDEYDSKVMTPMRELVTALTPAMLEIDELFICEPKVNKTISRIFRDTRYSKDKSTFRDVMWCHFTRGKADGKKLPGFFFELSPRGFNYGCGLYCMETDFLDSIKTLVKNQHPAFLKAKKCLEKQSIFRLEDDRYKRTKHKDYPEELRMWLDQKNICVMAHSEDFDMLFSDELYMKLSEDFKSIKPFYDFLMYAYGAK